MTGAIVYAGQYDDTRTLAVFADLADAQAYCERYNAQLWAALLEKGDDRPAAEELEGWRAELADMECGNPLVASQAPLTRLQDEFRVEAARMEPVEVHQPGEDPVSWAAEAAALATARG